MHFFTVLGDPVRRSIVERLLGQSLSSGEIVESVGGEFGISQSAISQQLKILRENGFATVAVEGNRRLYSLDPKGLLEMEQWLTPFRNFWEPKFAALENEIARGKREGKKNRMRK